MKPQETPDGRLDPGDVVAERYRIEKRLGEGGMGAVYSVRDLELDEVVAIKVLKPTGDAQMLDRFKREIRLARRVLHLNVCRTYEFGSWGNLKFIIMELVHGRTLKSLMENPELDLAAKLALFDGILAGLAAAHELGIIHRDMKPENVMVTDEQRPVIMDFGIAQELKSTGLTMTGNVIGTLQYMAPERLLGEKEIDQRSDIYSMGVILCELATGSRPFADGSVFEVAQAHISQPPRRPTEISPQVPRWLEDVILKMLVKRPEDRIQSINEVMVQLAAHAGQEIRPPRILLIDDDHDFLELLQQHLAHGGVQVLTARSGSEGIECLLHTGVDLVCLEYNLSDMDGFNVAIYVQMLSPDRRIPVLMVTSMDDPQYAKQASRVGIDRFFTKPLDIESFLMEVAKQLGS